MTREIKFRGLRTNGKGWVYGYYFGGYKWADFIIEDAGFEHRVQVIPESVGQLTGLYDKNGVEIYEGKNSVKLEVSGIGHEFADVILENGQFHVCSGDLGKAPLYEFLRTPIRIIVFANNESEVTNG